MSKAALRSEMKSRLLTANPEQAVGWSLDLCDRLLDWERMRAGRTVMAYLPLPGEADIRPVIRWVLERGMRLCLPRLEWPTRALVPAHVESLSDLVEGRYGIAEPPAAAPAVPTAELDLILVPGLAFDERGHRLGRGAGFYDRFLGGLGSCPAAVCGVAFELQIVQDVPVDPWDVRLHRIATESRWIEVA